MNKQQTAMHTCRHCGRPIIYMRGTWMDPEATGCDSIWRQMCDRHDTFTAEHEPKHTKEQRLKGIPADADKVA